MGQPSCCMSSPESWVFMRECPGGILLKEVHGTKGFVLPMTGSHTLSPDPTGLFSMPSRDSAPFLIMVTLGLAQALFPIWLDWGCP